MLPLVLADHGLFASERFERMRPLSLEVVKRESVASVRIHCIRGLAG